MNPAAVDRPFDPAILSQARKLASGYSIVLEPDDDLGYIGHPVELPNVFDDGRTPDECVGKVREAAISAVAYLLESGQSPPAPASENKRTEQINVRLTAREKMSIEAAARRDGYKGVSEFVRSAALATSSK